MINFSKKTGMFKEFDLHFESDEVSFSMLIGGNTDLYWLLTSEYNDNVVFNVEEKDEYWYGLLDSLFEEIKKVDNEYLPTINNNVFEWFSEDFPKEVASKVTITKEEANFSIRFTTNPNSFFTDKCSICFSNSGSKYPEIQRLFMIIYINLLKVNENDYKTSESKKLLTLKMDEK